MIVYLNCCFLLGVATSSAVTIGSPVWWAIILSSLGMALLSPFNNQQGSKNG